MPGKSERENGRKIRKETPFVVWLWVMGFTLLSYLAARLALYTAPHPIHWAFAAAGGVLGYFFGWLWFKWKGDVI